MLIIEADGGQHADNTQDRVRDAYMASLGYRTVRFWNSDVLANDEGVLTMILAALNNDEI